MSNSANLSSSIAQALLKVEAVALRPEQPFTWTSGLKSPIYCDNRITISYPEVRRMIANGFAQWIREQHPDAEVIAGIATGGIPHGAWVAEVLDLPMIYLRGSAKGHGKENLVEGVLKPCQKVVLIEDLISTGGSSLKAALAVREAGGEVLAVASIFTYEFDKAVQAFAAENIALHSLSRYTVLLEEALKSGLIEQSQLAMLQQWRVNPEAYGV